MTFRFIYSDETGSAAGPERQTGERRSMHKYEIVIYWSGEDRAFVADAPELPGCMAHGGDRESALRNVQEAMQFWIERAQELKRPARNLNTAT